MLDRCLELLVDIRKEFEKYILLPPGAADALSLWVLHAWTIDAGDISPFLVLASPTKRCGKTSVLIVLCYLTPRSELASNISASALFRYVEETRPTLLIDEADSFLESRRGDARDPQFRTHTGSLVGFTSTSKPFCRR